MTCCVKKRFFVPVTLVAGEVLLKMHGGHRLYSFLAVGGGAHERWRILPQNEVVVTPHGWSEKDKAKIDQWLAAERGFRAFMFPDQYAQFKNPLVDCCAGKLVIRSGKKKNRKKITPLE